MSSDAKIDKEIDCRLAKAISSFGRLYEQVWNNKHLKTIMKVSVYRADVFPTLLYGSQPTKTPIRHFFMTYGYLAQSLTTT